MIERGADVNWRSADGRTALMNSGSAEVARLLIAHGAQMNANTSDGDTALMTAARRGAPPDLIRVLIEHGADVNARTHGWKDGADDAKSPDIARLFIDHGAEVNARTAHGATAFTLAAAGTTGMSCVSCSRWRQELQSPRSTPRCGMWWLTRRS